ncbi:hypothetical protein TOPH_08845 [Tolypocladium ophioglossoides CBS 100239]|uniref:Uncharacterized protein n=1 Tax=Tolypocladium ophioglossoides (strain CBS 100239) TaxID=1163406 RepID=A0A0L0MXK5_TOLOC|nr:hypothetical protein TOPH_08845 [Tolypocladium ophioglossoides CBS 100239]
MCLFLLLRHCGAQCPSDTVSNALRLGQLGFDDGELRDTPEEARRLMDSLMAPMMGKAVAGDRLRILQVHDSKTSAGNARRHSRFVVASDTLQGTRRRYVSGMYNYSIGALMHVDASLAERTPTLEEMVRIRRNSVSVTPVYQLMEYAHSIKLPDEVFDDPVIQELEILGVDMVSMCVALPAA